MKKEINVQIGSRVRAARTRLGLSRDELAEALDISTLFLSYIECGQKGMSLSTLQNMCKTLQISADYLLLGQEPTAVDKHRAQLLLESLDPEYWDLAEESLQTLIRTIAAVRHKTRTENDPDRPPSREALR